jgi:autotransporter-associated beta strand protein
MPDCLPFFVESRAKTNQGKYSNTNLYLAQNNTITATNVYLPVHVRAYTQRPDLYLGKNTVVHADNIDVGYGVCVADVSFDSSWTGPSLTVRGSAGGTSRADLEVGRGNGNRAQGHMDLSGGTVDALLGGFVLGRGATSYDNHDGQATFRLSAGTVNANTLTMGLGTRAEGEGELYIAGGTLKAGTIAPGTGSGAVREINFSEGILGNRSGSDLVLEDGIDVTLSGDDTDSFIHADVGQSININAPLGGTGGFAKTGAGSLLLHGDNTFTDAVSVSEGSFGGTGSVDANVEVASNAHVAPGASTGTFTVGGDLSLADGAAYDWEASTEFVHDLLDVQGSLILPAGGSTIDLNLSLYDPKVTDATSDLELFTYNSISGGDFSSINWNINTIGHLWEGTPALFHDTANGAIVLQNVTFAPEPSAAALALIVLSFALCRRRWGRSCS